MALRADDVDLGRDRDLVLCAQMGDSDAFEDLYRRYFGRLYRFCLRRVGDPHEAEELAQEAFARAYGALPRLGGERRFYPWLSVIASRLCVDAFRRRARTEAAAVVDRGVLEGGEEKVDDDADVALIGRALDRLTPRHRHVLKLREQDGWSYQHIAEHYEVSLGTVEALLHRARKALRREFDVLAGADARRAAGLPVLGWLARRAEQARSRVAAWESAVAPVVGNAVVAGVVIVGSAVGLAPAGTPTSVRMAPAAVVGEAAVVASPAEAEAPQAAARPRAAAPAPGPAPAGPGSGSGGGGEGAATAPSGPIGGGAGNEARARAQEHPSGGDVPGTGTGFGVDPAAALRDAARTVDDNVDRFEEER